jgi:trypsin
VLAAVSRRLRSADLCAYLVFLGATGCGTAAETIEPSVELPPATPGYPAYTSRLTLNLDRTRSKQCHATLVAPQWAITAAHCFSEVSPDGRGRLRDFDRGFATQDVLFHPLAHESGSSTLDRVWHDEEFSAAHDLALIPLEPIELPSPSVLWSDRPGCESLELGSLPAHLGRLSRTGQPETASGIVLGARSAGSLLGPSQEGELLAVRSDGALPGDSGSGVTVRAADLGDSAENCLLSDPEGADVLVGVLQDASPLRPEAPLGVTPLYLPEHAVWVLETLATRTMLPGADERPVLDEPCLPGESSCN